MSLKLFIRSSVLIILLVALGFLLKTYEFNKRKIRTNKILLKHKGLYKENKYIRLNDTSINDQGFNIEDNMGNDFQVELVKLEDDIKEYTILDWKEL